MSVAKEGLTADNHFHEHQQDEIISTKEGERMRILTIGALLVLAMVKLLPVNVMAQNTGQCDFLKEPLPGTPFPHVNRRVVTPSDGDLLKENQRRIAAHLKSG